MLRPVLKSAIALIIATTLCTCIDPYSPKLKGYESLLVVDGLMTDENSSYSVKLSKTIAEEGTSPVIISDAKVFITDDELKSFSLESDGGGIYKTDSVEFRGFSGRTYILHIITSEGNEYESDPCAMQSVPEIDSIYFESGQELDNNGTEIRDGLRILLDTKGSTSNNYYRWDFEETWKFKIPIPKRYDYKSGLIVPLANIKQYCWKKKLSNEVLIHSMYSGQSGMIQKKQIHFIASDRSDRLMMEYSILVNQYSISKNEYEFWDNLKRINDNGGDIFAAQPYPVISNLHNINNQKERVLGYFQVSAVKQKRIFIPFRKIVELHLPFYHYDQCVRIEKSPADFTTKYGTPETFDGLYTMYCIREGYNFIEPIYNPDTHLLEKMVFALPECSDCEVTGSSAKPDFWQDIN
jgi:hypothetical protein